MRSRAAQGIVATVVALLVAGAVAVAGNRIECPGGGGVCQGTTGNDILVGTPAGDAMYADAGNDRLRGRGALDQLRGEGGDDILNGGLGGDLYEFYGSAWGKDVITGDTEGAPGVLVFFPTGTDAVEVDLNPKRGEKEVTLEDTVIVNTINIAKGTRFARVQTGEGADTIRGTPEGQQLSGADNGDKLIARGGNDLLSGDFDAFGDVGDDTMLGGDGKDRFFGGDGNDTIKAKDGEKDEIDCGDGTDTVVFDHGLDKLEANCEV